MNPAIGHNGGPDIEGRKESLRTTWAKALFADPETPVYVMAMAWAIHWYSRADGTGAALSNEQLKLICGISEPTATRGKRWLRDNGYIQLKVGTGDQKTQFRMSLPTKEMRVEVAAGVISETTQGNHIEGPQGDEGHQKTAPGNQADDPGVICGLGYIQESKPISIPEKSAPRAQGTSLWQQAFNPTHSDYQFDGVNLVLVNGTRSRWLIEFGDDPARLGYALKEAAGRIQPHGSKPIEIQVEAQLAKIAAEKRDRDARYAQAAKANKPKTTESEVSRWAKARR
jgi:hypothetical protein